MHSCPGRTDAGEERPVHCVEFIEIVDVSQMARALHDICHGVSGSFEDALDVLKGEACLLSRGSTDHFASRVVKRPLPANEQEAVNEHTGRVVARRHLLVGMFDFNLRHER